MFSRKRHYFVMGEVKYVKGGRVDFNIVIDVRGRLKSTEDINNAADIIKNLIEDKPDKEIEQIFIKGVNLL